MSQNTLIFYGNTEKNTSKLVTYYIQNEFPCKSEGFHGMLLLLLLPINCLLRRVEDHAVI